MARTITLRFEGYYRTERLPPERYRCSGIYLVYRGEHIGVEKCTLAELLYIGESEDVGARPGEHHEKYNEWCRYLDLDNNEIPYYSFAKVSDIDRERTEAALIFHHKPPCNVQSTDSFKHSETRVVSSGNCKFLDKDFIVSP